ncbi:uncharacterized protein MICPUCDRAFT_57566 [Micromonas pusilla CCMP1545]|jgi:hypothetical protein|uniref:Predicted protein n=2 Tax=Micromonas pusilla TaxID=38833 RepID=C1MR86_MICPC|nr:uncharacterized protein MICPUCDRAFT_57566 [Micromonas pusilla CCMP1545]EEH57839.1 predicted protein [Micromonas pusilla CCMP1545]|eukprot:XP_003057888.1 predicted protein [Micromonas pusilla CCMP1545]
MADPSCDGADVDQSARDTKITDLDVTTLSNVLSHLSTEDVLSLSSASKHLRECVDESVFKRLLLKLWDEPVWEVTSYRELFLARHRALEFIARVGAHDGPEDWGSDDASRSFANAKIACDELASAVNASWRVPKDGATDSTMGREDIERALVTTLVAVDRGSDASRREDAARRAATALSVCACLGAVATRCPSARARYLDCAREAQHAKALDRFLRAPGGSPTSGVFAEGFRAAGGAPPARASAAAPPSLDALAASLGGAPARDPHPFPPNDGFKPSIDAATALFYVPIVLYGRLGRVDARGARARSHPFLDADLLDDASVPSPPSLPGRGPYPRGGRPPHGQRLRMESQAKAPAVGAMAGAWAGCRVRVSPSLDAAGAGAGAGAKQNALTVESVFRATMSVTPDGRISGWIADTVGNLTMRGRVDAAENAEGGRAVVIDAAYDDCGGVPGAMFRAASHGVARTRLAGWVTGTAVGGEWWQWSAGVVSKGMFLMWPNDAPGVSSRRVSMDR